MMQPIQNFIVFCLESYRQKNESGGNSSFELFKYNGVFEFLTENYEVLHTQGKDYILEEIATFLKSRHAVISR